MTAPLVNLKLHRDIALEKIAVPIEHTPRTYTSDGYVLPSDEQEKERLELQHRMLRLAFEDRVLLAPLPSRKDVKVLECGTGSGVWLLDLATEIQGQMHGFDIEPRLFPREHAANLSFSVASVTNLPREWGGQYTLVHQRLLLGGLNATEWKDAISEMYRVLAPGGYIQLCEAGPWKAGPATEKNRALVRALFNSRELLLDCVDHIPHMLSEVGFTEIRTETRTIPMGKWAGKTGIDCRNNYIGVLGAMKTPILRSGGFGYVKSEADFEQLLGDIKEEWDETPNAVAEFFIFVAQKPQ